MVIYQRIKKQDSLKDKTNIIKHEIAHGLFYLNSTYRRNVINILNGHDFSDIHSVSLKKYDPKVWLDEVHAYLVASSDELKEKGINIRYKYDGIINVLFENFYTYYKDIANID
jgi:hypothetical protein